MSHYIDGFAFPIATNKLASYRTLANAVATIWREHGAIDYREYCIDDESTDGTGSFTEQLSARHDETIIFGWVAFPSREARAHANEKVAADPRMVKLVNDSDCGFDPRRMAYGGFRPLVCSPARSL